MGFSSFVNSLKSFVTPYPQVGLITIQTLKNGETHAIAYAGQGVRLDLGKVKDLPSAEGFYKVE